MPPLGDAPGRPELLRGGRAGPRPGRHVRRAPSRGGHGRPGRPVQRRGAWPCWSTCPGWASASPRSPPSATSWTCPATTCSSGGPRTASPGSACCTWSRSGTRASSPAPRPGSARTMPVLTVHAGRSAPGQRAAASHTAAAAAPLITRQALFEQAGIIATTSFGELLEAAVLLASQPVPAGSRVCVISNAGGAGVLAADACAEAGLAVATLSHPAQARLAAILPASAALGGPVDTTAAVSAGDLRRRPGRGGRRHRRGRGHRAGRPDRGRRPDPGAQRGPAARPAGRRGAGPAGRGPAAAAALGPPGRPGRSRVRLSRERGPGAQPGRALRLLAVPARGHGPGDQGHRCRRGPRADRLVHRPGPRRRLAARRRGGPAAALLRAADGGVPAGRHRGRGGGRRRGPGRPGGAQGRGVRPGAQERRRRCPA